MLEKDSEWAYQPELPNRSGLIIQRQGLLYTRTDFVPKVIAKRRPKTRFNRDKSEVAKIHCVI